MKPRLVSFELCPFVQRSVITLRKKGVDFDIDYIDLENKPDWFLKMSPLGKVPVVQIGDDVLFESAVINEYLDETNPPSLHPVDPIQKAKDRAWIEFGSQVLVNHYMLSVAEDEEAFKSQLEALKDKMARLEGEKGDGLYFRGDNFQLIDSALAPVFVRMKILEDVTGLQLLSVYPKLAGYTDALEKLEFVTKSVPEGFRDKYIEYLTGKGTYLSAIIRL